MRMKKHFLNRMNVALGILIAGLAGLGLTGCTPGTYKYGVPYYHEEPDDPNNPNTPDNPGELPVMYAPARTTWAPMEE